MISSLSSFSLIKRAYNSTAKHLKNSPAILLPFVIFAGFEVLSLIILYLAPRMPFAIVLAPPIRVFWGESFLHYPANFLLLPKLASLSKMLLAVVLGSLLTGTAVAMVFDIYSKKQLKLSGALKLAFKQYISLFTLILILVITLYLTDKLITGGLYRYFASGHTRLLFLKPQLWLGPMLVLFNLLFVIIIQSLVIYAIPILVIEKANLIKAIIKSAVLFKKFFIPTIALVALPLLIYIPIIVLNYNIAFLIERLFPEFVLGVLFLSIVIGSLVIDPVVTVSTTVLYLMSKEKA
jgi:hypothetical protein